MRHPDFGDPISRELGADHELRRDESRPRLELAHEGVDHPPLEQLERAVDIAHVQIENRAQHDVVHAGDDQPVPRIATLDPVADNDVCRLERGEQRPDFGEMELQVSIGEKHGVTGTLLESGTQSVAVAEVLFVLHEADLWVPRCVVAHDLRGAVRGTVVDNEYLETLGELRERGERLVVTDRNRPVAELGPPPATGDTLDRLIAEGRVSRPLRRGLPEPLALHGDPRALTVALDEIRGDR